VKIYRIDEMEGGWFVGAFEPSAFLTYNFELAYKEHQRGEPWPRHVHHEAVEINLLIHGLMVANDRLIHPGDIFVVEQGEAVKPLFLEDCALIVAKTPSIPGDKEILEE